MARLSIDDDAVVVRLNWIEKFAAWRWRQPRAPLASIRSVETLGRSGPTVVQDLVYLSLPASNAPLGGVATVGPRANDFENRPALVITYFSGPAVLLRFDERSSWGLWLISSRRAEAVAESIRRA